MRERRKRQAVILAGVLVCCAIVLAGLSAYGRRQMAKVPDLTFEEAMAYTTSGNDDAVITVGVVRGGGSACVLRLRGATPEQDERVTGKDLAPALAAALLATLEE